jgi:hypothetical protein
MTPPGAPDPWDRDLAAVHDAVDYLGTGLAIWHARTEPDAHARRCASDAVDAIDGATNALFSIRSTLITQIRQADDQAAARADEMLARLRDGPPGHAQGDHRTTRPQRQPDAKALCDQGNAGGDDGREPREATP